MKTTQDLVEDRKRFFGDNPIRRQMDLARGAIRAVMRGDKKMQMLCSNPGIGKTWTVSKEFKKAGHDIRALGNIAPQNVFALCQTLWLAKLQELPVVVLDDCDTLARTEAAANVFKMAFGPTGKVITGTVASFKNEARKELGKDFDANIPPPFFYTKANLVWLSNKNFTDEKIIDSEMVPHFRAMVSRGLDPIWIDSSNPQHMFDYTLWLDVEQRLLIHQNQAPNKQQHDAGLAWWVANRHRLREISPRSLVDAVMRVKQFNGEPETRDGMLKLLLKPANEPDWQIV